MFFYMWKWSRNNPVLNPGHYDKGPYIWVLQTIENISVLNAVIFEINSVTVCSMHSAFEDFFTN